jgi:MinD superfamily P-loop ATPase
MQIATYINEEYGIASLITQISRGYSVVLVDTDAEEILPNVRIFPLTMLDQAIEYAKKIANIKE